ncbi:hypothetical protein [Hymenobacter terrenus]|uniref:hypothetical protein n=1 Tax=Hymenobacter terrenus TaxID=1629124 RepID=UPI00061919EC|nr:hypothetical protein [Hymenobacter terrenus]
MTITPHPDWATVWADEQWQGFFYPLCRVSGVPGLPTELALLVLSTNGLWYDEAFATAEASAHFTVFRGRGGQVAFDGDRRLFKGYAVVAEFRARLAADWARNQAQYLAATTPEQLFAVDQLPPLATPAGFDAVYFLETFRSFCYVREQYRRTGRFRSINAWLRGWHEEPGAFFVPATHADFRDADAEARANQAYLFPTLDLAVLHPVGLVPAAPYFPDGNTMLLYFDPVGQRLVCVHHYG